jgi:hypothetical protein
MERSDSAGTNMAPLKDAECNECGDEATEGENDVKHTKCQDPLAL